MRKLLSAGVALLLLAMSPSLQAYACDECYCGFYGQVFGGVNLVPDADLEYFPIGAGVSHHDEFDFDIGWGLGAAVGHQWDCGWAAEFEVSYRDNCIDKHHDLLAATDANGDLTVWAFMVNGYYRWHNDCFCFVPYLGVGAGVGRASLDNKFPADAVIHDDDTTLAYQGILGVSYCICDCWDLFLEYRYFGLADIEYRTSTHRIDSCYDSHMIDIGMRFAVE